MQRPALCTFLHGPLTSSVAITQMQLCLSAEEERHLEVLLYKKDGMNYMSSFIIMLLMIMLPKFVRSFVTLTTEPVA